MDIQKTLLGVVKPLFLAASGFAVICNIIKSIEPEYLYKEITIITSIALLISSVIILVIPNTDKGKTLSLVLLIMSLTSHAILINDQLEIVGQPIIGYVAVATSISYYVLTVFRKES